MIPFRYGQVVSREHFCGRKDILKQVMGFIQSGQNSVILGERRVGKTSLILEAARRAKAKVLYTDFFLVKSIDDICRRILRGIFELEQKEAWHMKILKLLAHLRPVVAMDPISMLPSVHFESAFGMKADSIPEVLRFVERAAVKKETVIVFDEFQGILNIPESREVLALMRNSIQFHSDIPYIFAGSIRHRMDRIFNDSGSPFFKSAIPLTLEPLTFEEFSVFLKRKFLSGKRSASDDVMRKVFDIAANIPGDIQQLCEALWEETEEGDEITTETISKALTLIFAREQESYKAYYNLLTDLQARCLIGLAKEGGKNIFSSAFLKAISHTNTSSVRKAVGRLVSVDIVFERHGEYRFVNPFFKAWLLHIGK